MPGTIRRSAIDRFLHKVNDRRQPGPDGRDGVRETLSKTRRVQQLGPPFFRTLTVMPQSLASEIDPLAPEPAIRTGALIGYDSADWVSGAAPPDAGGYARLTCAGTGTGTVEPVRAALSTASATRMAFTPSCRGVLPMPMPRTVSRHASCSASSGSFFRRA